MKTNLKAVTTIHIVTGWFKIIQYDDKRAISIVKLVETTWLARYPQPMEIMYAQVSEFIGHEFIKSPIEKEYGMLSKPRTLDLFQPKTSPSFSFSGM